MRIPLCPKGKARWQSYAILTILICLFATQAWALEAAYIQGATKPGSTNEAAMDRAFADGWDDLRMADGAGPFLPESGYKTIFLEGSDLTALELNTFLNDHRATIENWVSAGGRLFLNAAPNEGGNIDFGFGGVTLNYLVEAWSVVAADPDHAVFNGPYLPIATAYTGSGFAHAYLTGGELTSLIIGAPSDINPGAVVLGEKVFGKGRVLLGGMTLDFFHLPQPEAANLRANILRYLRGDTIINPGFETGDLSGWTAITEGGSYLYALSGTDPVYSAGSEVPPAPEGEYVGFSDCDLPGRTILYQDLLVPMNAASLTAVIYVVNLAEGGYVDGPGLDFISYEPTVIGDGGNQKVRLDLMDPAAPVDDMGDGVLENIFITLPGDPNNIGPEKVRVNLEPYAGTTVRLRMAVVQDRAILVAGLDDVRVVEAGSGGDGGSSGCFISTLK